MQSAHSKKFSIWYNNSALQNSSEERNTQLYNKTDKIKSEYAEKSTTMDKILKP